MKFWVGMFLGILVGIIFGFVINNLNIRSTNREISQVVNELPLLKYTIENLGKRSYVSNIILDEITATQSSFFVQKFHFDSDEKRVTGLAHLPINETGQQKFPVIVQIRGYAEPDGYQSGYGTWRSAEKFAEAGFISLAPDFLGYGGSASPSADVFEGRFETYTTVMNLLAAIDHWPLVESGRIGLWGHSNGGQIAVTVLEASGKNYPTTLWAPMTAGFPYSILFFMNDNNEGDKLLRKKLVDFENDYDAGQFNILNYLQKINAPIQIHQGTADKSVPFDWNRSLANKISDIRYWEYAGADHNLFPDWDLVVRRDIEFFREKMGLTD